MVHLFEVLVDEIEQVSLPPFLRIPNAFYTITPLHKLI